MNDSKTKGQGQDQDYALPQGMARETQDVPEALRPPAQTLATGEFAPHTPPLSDKQLQALKANSFQKGKSGNPGGRPKAEVTLREMARGYTKEAVEKVANLMRTAKDSKVQLRAAEVLLDRGYGRTPQATTLPEQDGLPGDELTDEALDKTLDA